MPKARESLKATEGAFRAGKAGFLDVLDAEPTQRCVQRSTQVAAGQAGIVGVKLKFN